MIEINNKVMCELCFSELKDGKECCKCSVEKNINKTVLNVGTTLNGKYIVGKPLFYDGDAGVLGYVGFDAADNKRVIIRELYPERYINNDEDSKYAKRIELEDDCVNDFERIKADFCHGANIASEFRSDTVAHIEALFEERGTLYSIAEYPEKAVLLSEYIREQGGKIGENTAIRILGSAIDSLDRIHRKGIIHGNIRPENVLISGKHIVFLGLKGCTPFASKAGTSETIHHKTFAPIEAYRTNGIVGEYTDIYALGATIYYALNGKSNHDGGVSQNMDVRSGTGVTSVEFDRVLRKMLAEKTSDRFPDLYSLAKSLKKAGLVSLKVKPHSKKSLAKKSHNVSRRIVVAVALSGVVLLMTVAVAGIWWMDRNKSNAETEQEEVVTAHPEDITNDVEQDETAIDVENDTNNGKEPELEIDVDEVKEIINGNSDKETENGKDKEGTEDEDKEKDEGEIEGDITENTVLSGGWYENTMCDTSNPENTAFVFGNSKYLKRHIFEIEIAGSLENAPESAWDVSEKKDNSVMAWVENIGGNRYKLYLGAEGGIDASFSTANLFAGYVKVEFVKFNGDFHTDFATDFTNMFKNCQKLKELDLSGMNTNLAKSMKGMFDGCRSIEKIHFSDGFVTKSVVDMSRMFANCTLIKELELSSFTSFSAENLKEMFSGCKSLEKLDMSGFTGINEVDVTDVFADCGKLTECTTHNGYIREAFEQIKE